MTQEHRSIPLAALGMLLLLAVGRCSPHDSGGAGAAARAGSVGAAGASGAASDADPPDSTAGVGGAPDSASNCHWGGTGAADPVPQPLGCGMTDVFAVTAVDQSTAVHLDFSWCEACSRLFCYKYGDPSGLQVEVDPTWATLINTQPSCDQLGVDIAPKQGATEGNVALKGTISGRDGCYHALTCPIDLHYHVSTQADGAAPTVELTDPLPDRAQGCVDAINEYRASLGLPAYARWTAGEACAARQADQQIGLGSCSESAQNNPGHTYFLWWMVLQWEAGPGHEGYDNVASTTYHEVACGFAGPSTWRMVQNFR